MPSQVGPQGMLHFFLIKGLSLPVMSLCPLQIPQAQGEYSRGGVTLQVSRHLPTLFFWYVSSTSSNSDFIGLQSHSLVGQNHLARRAMLR